MDVPLIGGGKASALAADPVVDTDKIREHLQQIRDALAPVMASDQGGLALDFLEVSLGITAKGEVGFIAKGSLEGTASITLTFKRPGASS